MPDLIALNEKLIIDVLWNKIVSKNVKVKSDAECDREHHMIKVKVCFPNRYAQLDKSNDDDEGATNKWDT